MCLCKCVLNAFKDLQVTTKTVNSLMACDIKLGHAQLLHCFHSTRFPYFTCSLPFLSFSLFISPLQGTPLVSLSWTHTPWLDSIAPYQDTTNYMQEGTLDSYNILDSKRPTAYIRWPRNLHYMWEWDLSVIDKFSSQLTGANPTMYTTIQQYVNQKLAR